MEESPRKEVGLGRMIVMLAVFTALVVAYDAWCLLSGNAKEGLYVMPFALLAFIAIVAKIKSHLERMPPADRARLATEVHKDSCCHPDNRPKGRTDAPDGLSD